MTREKRNLRVTMEVRLRSLAYTLVITIFGEYQVCKFQERVGCHPMSRWTPGVPL